MIYFQKRWLLSLGAMVVAVFFAGISLRAAIESRVDRNMKDAQRAIAKASVASAPLNRKVVAAPDGTYALFVPQDWRVEKDSAVHFAIYPDAAGAMSTKLGCKIEISEFAVGLDINLDDWVTKNLHADRTLEVTEYSRAPIAIASTTGILWRGVWNGIATTAAYARYGGVNLPGHILEIVPIAVGGGNCDPAFRELLSHFSFEQP